MIEGLDILLAVLEQGLIYSLVVMSIYLSSRIIQFDDLTVEGSFGIGGAINAFIITSHMSGITGIIGAMLAGCLAGICTGLIHTKLKLNNLISGIVVTTALFSVILKIAGANLPLIGASTLFSLVPLQNSAFQYLIILIPINVLLIFSIRWFLNTEIGFLIRTLGTNPQMLTTLGKSTDFYKILTLMIANMLAGLSGALYVQKVGYFSIWSNVGILIIGLAGLIISEIFSKKFDFAIIAGAIMYQAIIALTYEFQIDQDWNKLITALLIIVVILLKNSFKKK